MRIPITIATCLAFTQLSQAQISADGMGNEFSQVAKFGSRGSGFEGFQTYSSGTVEGSQFFAPSWTSGTVTTTGKETFGKGFVFIYDKVRQELFIKPKDSNVVLQGDKSQIASFTLNTDKVHFFVAGAQYDPAQRGNFYELLINNAKGYTLLKMIRTKFEKANPRDIEKQRLGEVYDAFIDQITYYISISSGLPVQVALKERSIRKALPPAAQKKMDEFMKNRDDNTIDEAFLISLTDYLNRE